MAKTIVKKSAAKIIFDDLLDSSKKWVEWIDGVGKFESVLKRKIPWEVLDSAERATVQQQLDKELPTAQLMLNSFYITMVAGFEEFLRSTIRELATQMSGSGIQFDDVDEELLRLHIKESAKLLRKIDSPPDYIAYNEMDLCRRLGTCVPGSEKIELNGDAFAEIDALLKLENFLDRAALLGKKVNWDELGKNSSVKKAMRMERDGTRAVANALAHELEDIARFRNRIAHTGGNAADVTAQLIRDHTTLLSAIADVIANA